MIRNILLIVIAAMMFYAEPAQACMATDDSNNNLSETLLDFNDGCLQGLRTGSSVTDQWKEFGVTFGDGTVKWSKSTLLGSPGLYGSVLTGTIGSIYFSRDVNSAAFQFFTLPTWSDSITIQAKNNGIEVDSITIPQIGNWYQTDVWYSFAGNTFDEINFNTGTIYWNLDNLKYTSVPIPAAFWFLGSGMLGLIGLKRKLPIGGCIA